MSARKAVENELSTEQILQVARELFVVKGYHEVSMREIARKLGYSHGAIYYHFKNKAELFSNLVVQDFHLLDEKLEEIVSQPYEVRDILLGFIQFGMMHPHHFEVMFLMKDLGELYDVQQKPMESFEKFAHYVSQVEKKFIHPQQIWSLFISVFGFVTYYHGTEQTYEDVKGLAETHVSILVKGIS